MQHVPVVAKCDRVAGIMSALITGDAVEFLGEDVDDFAFAFISPLETYDCEVHRRIFRRVLVEGFRDDFLADGADNLFLHLAVFEEKQGRNPADAEFGRCGAVGVDIEFADFDAAFVLLCNGFDGWRQCPARSAPRCPEIDQYGDGGLGDFGFEFASVISTVLALMVSSSFSERTPKVAKGAGLSIAAP